MGGFRATVAIAIVVGVFATTAGGNEVSRAKALEGMQVCESTDRMPADKKQEKLQTLDKGLKISEAAVAADPADARAHLAVICNLGRQVEIAGLSWRIFGQVRRLQAEADKALELAPDDADILTTKGQMLRQLPGPLGGSKEVGMKLLRRAVEVQPEHVTARLYLAQAMADDGAPDARKRLYEALALAKKRGTAREQAEAQQLIASLDD
jgi:hypothetical protein